MRNEARRLGRLAAPIVFANLAWMTIGTVDLAMLGRVSPDAVAAASLGNVWVHLTQMLGMGLVMGMDPEVTQGHGARDRRLLGHALQRGIVIGLLVAVPVVILRAYTAEFLLAARDFAVWLGERGGLTDEARAALELDRFAELAQPAERYALAQSFAAPFFLIFIALRQYLQGRGIVRPALYVALLGNVVNAAANGVLIFGLDLGLLGAGIATGVTRTFMAALLAWIVVRLGLLRGGWVPWERAALRPGPLLRTIRCGLPIGLHFAFEVGAFGTTTLLAGLLGVTATVAHTVSINVASVTFMIPLGIALAATTRIGNLVGERRYDDAQLSSRVALFLGAGVMAGLGALLFLLREQLPLLYTDEAAIVALAASVLPLAAAFQVFDGLQVVGGGILRGMGSTTPPAVFNFIAWWLLALPLAAWWVVGRGDGDLVDVWIALTVGLGVVAALTVAWVRWRGPAHLGATAAAAAQRSFEASPPSSADGP
ncbi:MAG: MATE family efflux transporter [Planctomycetota bacterium]